LGGWSYLKTIHAIVTGNEFGEDTYLLPARQISFQNEKTRELFDEAHTLGEWVINCDSLLEPRQLKNQGVQVIKYQHSRTQGPSMVVSSKSHLSMLKVLVKRRLEALNLSLEDKTLARLTEDFIDDANSISGDIVLRAAKKGVFASELLGVVLSKTLISSEIVNAESISWFFLDDYASWLGQKEEQIADILALSPQMKDGQPYLKVIISEAKYVDSKGGAEAKRNSQKQLWDTVSRMHSAIFGNPGRLDRDLWLSRLSDLLNDGVEVPPDSPINVETWRDGIRNGTIPIQITGYSHVFMSSADVHVESERVQLSNVEECFQEVYSRDRVRDLVLAYVKGETVLPIREQIGEDTPWLSMKMQLPAPRVKLIESDCTDEQTDSNGIFDTAAGDTVIGSGNLSIDLGSPSSVPKIEDDVLNEKKNSVWAIPKLDDWIKNKNMLQEENTDTEAWVVNIVNTLKASLISYNLQAKVLDHRLTPNAVIVKLKGSDQLKIDDIEKKRSQCLTTQSIDIDNH